MDLSQFHCLQCGECCRQSGYVRLRKNEPDIIAAFLEMNVYEFIEKYTELTQDRQTLSLIDKEAHTCIFFTDQGCRINAVKPQQCRDFPRNWRFTDFNNICRWAKKRSG